MMSDTYVCYKVYFIVLLLWNVVKSAIRADLTGFSRTGFSPSLRIGYINTTVVLVLLVHEVANMDGHLGEPAVPIFN